MVSVYFLECGVGCISYLMHYDCILSVTSVPQLKNRIEYKYGIVEIAAT